jgi:RNA polymerase-binding transcription factor DksA
MSKKVPESLHATREKLLLRAAELRERLTRVKADLGRRTEPLPRDAPDAAIALENDEVLAAIEVAAVSELSQIDQALGRMNDGVFGLCESCAAPIDPERLAAVPYASQCAGCAKAA